MKIRDPLSASNQINRWTHPITIVSSFKLRLIYLFKNSVINCVETRVAIIVALETRWVEVLPQIYIFTIITTLASGAISPGPQNAFSVIIVPFPFLWVRKNRISSGYLHQIKNGQNEKGHRNRRDEKISKQHSIVPLWIELLLRLHFPHFYLDGISKLVSCIVSWFLPT